MKILYIITQADGGGAQRYTLSLARHFSGTLAAGNETTQLFEEAAGLDIPTVRLSHLKRSILPYHDLWAIWEIVRLIKKIKPDIVHLNSSKAGFLGSIAGKLAGCKVVYTAHGFVFNEPLSPLRRQMYKDLEHLATLFRDHIITVSEVDRLSALASKIVSENKITTIHNGIARHRFLPKEDARTKLSLPHGKFIFGTIANFYETKGLDILIEAIRVMPKKSLDNVMFAVIGYGNEAVERQLKKLITSYRLNEYALLIGKVPNGWQYLQAFDAYVLPSRKEGFPYALLDALQAGLPIITTDVGGNKEAVGDAALLVPSENPKALTEALQTVSLDAQKRAELSQKALQRSELFTQEKMFEETKKVYEKLLTE